MDPKLKEVLKNIIATILEDYEGHMMDGAALEKTIKENYALLNKFLLDK